MKTKTPGVFRAMAVLLVLIMVLSMLPVSAFAAYDFDEIPEEMLNNSILRALAYLGYDVDFPKSEETLYKYITGELVEKYPSKFPYPVPYCSDGIGTGLQTSSINTGYTNVTSVTGKYPNVSKFESTGLDCVDFAAYYLINYLPNIEGANIDWLDDIVAKYSGSGYTYDNMYFWPKAQKDLAAAGVKIWTVNDVDFSNGEVSKYTDSQGNVCTEDIYQKLKIGTLIQMNKLITLLLFLAVIALVAACSDVRVTPDNAVTTATDTSPSPPEQEPAPLQWIALGDSITEGLYSYLQEDGTQMRVLDPESCWAATAARINGWKLTNYGVSGSGYVYPGLDGLNARERVDTIDFSGADLVTLSFGVNDWKHNSVLGSICDDPAPAALYAAT